MAKLIYLEIRRAEENIREFQKYKDPSNLFSIIESDNWVKYNYLFVNNLNIDDITVLNLFYEKCRKANYELLAIKKIISLSIEQKAIEIQNLLLDLAKDKDENSYDIEKDRILKIYQNEAYVFSPHLPIIELLKHTESINFITTTTTGEKIKKIAKIN